MPNEPKHAKEKRANPGHREHAQGDHERSAHIPDEFDVMKPKQQDLDEKTGAADKRPLGRRLAWSSRT